MMIWTFLMKLPSYEVWSGIHASVNWVIIGSGNGLVTSQQANIWTNADSVHLRIYSLPNLKGLIRIMVFSYIPI